MRALNPVSRAFNLHTAILFILAAVSKHELHRVTKDEHAEVMSRLEQLEKEEDEQKEHAAEAAAAATLVNDLPPPPLDIGTRSLQAPKGVPQKVCMLTQPLA